MRIRTLLTAWTSTVVSATNAGLFGVQHTLSLLRGGSSNSAPSCCFITSQSVSHSVRETVSKELSSSLGTTISQPTDCWQAVADGSDVIVFRPDVADLQRGEGLWTMLGPIMERNGPQASLCIIAANDDIEDCRSKLEQAALQLIPYLSSSTSSSDARTLHDVFRNVRYVSSPQEAAAVAAEWSNASTAIATIASKKTTVPLKSHAELTPANLAAARRLGVDARRQVDDTLATIRRACSTDDGTIKMVSNFGDLCKASIRNAKLKGMMEHSHVSKQMQLYVKSSLEHSLVDLYDQQVNLLEDACFDEFRGKLSTLKITPNLPSDMAKLADQAVSRFAKAASRMAVPGAVAPTIAFRRRLTEYVSARLLKAQATNKFRPVPRKGITVGFHWLLPKPFGNDYRQEPWKVHATDNMVYVPSALADMNPEQVAEGTWRDAIVPLPSGKDMLYMQ